MITITKAEKSFGNLQALKSISLHIPEGSIYGLIGSNGSGKSTLLRAIAGIYCLESGDVSVDGQAVFEQPDVKAALFYISDDQYTERNGCILEMAQRYATMYPNYDVDYALEVAKFFKLDPTRRFKTFSKGMIRQSHIILGLAAKTKYLLCDETFDGLDPVKRQAVKKLLAEAVLERQATVVIASHNLRELEDICDHVGFIHQGELVLERNMDDLATGIYKLQTAFDHVHRQADFADFAPVSFEQRGRMISMIVRGDYDALHAQIAEMQPLYSEILPLTLEEIFIAEMEVRGYDINDLVL